MIVLGPASPLSVLCLVIQFISFAFVVASHRSTSPITSHGITPWVLLWASCSYQAFFTSGHSNTFSSLQNAAGFVGFDEFNFYTAGALLGLNTFGCFAFAILALPWLDMQLCQPRHGKANSFLAFPLYFALNALVSTLFVALQRRHLMVWAIFAPKFIFDGVVLLVTELLLLILLAPFQSANSGLESHLSYREKDELSLLQ
ncbi:putative GPI ethanolamine phosphate transferase 3 [Plasmopara halstedii]